MNIAVFCGSRYGSRPCYREAAARLGSWIAQAGHTLVYGGEKTGLMNEVADAALAAGGSVIGVVPNIPLMLVNKHPGLTQVIDTADMAERKKVMLEISDAFICLPGGIGTVDEFGDAMTAIQLGLKNAVCILFDENGYYRSFHAALEHMADEGFIDRPLLDRLLLSSDTAEIAGFLERFTD